jgi:hypothetical protein
LEVQIEERLINTNPTKNRDDLKCSGMAISSCSIIGTRRVTLRVKSYGRGKEDEIVTTTNGTYPW